jgi:hypothetical protein
MQRHTITAVHDDDLESLMKSLGLLWDFENGKLKCAFCGDPVDRANLYGLFPDSGAIKTACSRAHCVAQLSHRAKGSTS